MARIKRIRKRDKPISQVRKVVQQEIANHTIDNLQPAVYLGAGGSLGTPPGTGGDNGVQVQVDAFGSDTPGVVVPAIRAKITPEGAVYAVDDAVNERIKLRHSPLADPLFILNL